VVAAPSVTTIEYLPYLSNLQVQWGRAG
jgi:hypothetical protein